MRLLIISPLFPPLADSEAFCGGKFVQGLIDAGSDPWVIYCSNVRKPLRSDTSLFWNSLEARGIDVPSPKKPDRHNRNKIATFHVGNRGLCRAPMS